LLKKNFSAIFVTIACGMLLALLLALIIGFFIKAYGFYFLMLTLACVQIVYSKVDGCYRGIKWFIGHSNACFV
jgi:branched-chain amino acid transport system permease protein